MPEQNKSMPEQSKPTGGESELTRAQGKRFQEGGRSGLFLVLLVEAGWPPSYEGGYGESRIDGRGDGVFLVLGSWFLVLGSWFLVLGGCGRG